VSLALAFCLGAQADSVSTSGASVAIAARATQPPRCPIGTSAGQPGNCLLDEGWSNDCTTAASCKDAGLGPTVHPLRPVASALRIRVSSTTVEVGDRITVSASISAPRCTYALVNSQTRCWNSLQFGDRPQYLPNNYGGGYNPPLVRYDPACGGLPYYQPYKSTSCSGTIIWNYGPRKILPGHLMVITVEDNIIGKDLNQLDFVEIALRFGARPKCGSPGAAACPLQVLISAPKSIRSGLGVHDLFAKPSPQSVVDFLAAKHSAPYPGEPLSGFRGDTFQCESGCADVLVTVRDPKTHELVEGSKVDARVTSLPDAPGGREYICETKPETGETVRCGPGALLGLETDHDGRAYLRYWAPGVIKPTSVTLQVTATGGTCVPHPCRAARESGHADYGLTVKPYLIYEHTAPLTREDIAELANWGAGPSLFKVFLAGSLAAEKALTLHLKWLEEEATASEKILKTLEHLEATPVKIAVGVLDLIDAYNDWTELKEHWAMMGLFLQTTALSGTGLGNDPMETSSPAYPTYAFSKQLADYNGLIPGNAGELVGKGESGALWDIATNLHTLVEHKDFSVQPGAPDHWGIQLQVYEISHCDPDESCGPGYDDDRGIQAELYFRIAVLYDGKASPGGAGLYTFTTPYDALAWAAAEQTGAPPYGKVMGLIPESK